MRQLNRKKLHISDGLEASIELPNKILKGHVVDLTPNGLGILLPEQTQTALMSITCTIKISHKNSNPIELVGVIVRETDAFYERKHFKRIGVSLLEHTQPKGNRTNHRIAANPFFPPTASAKHPYIFCHELFFTVLDFSPKGVGLQTSLSNKLLYKGMKLGLEVHLPKVGSIQVEVELRNISKKENAFQINAAFIGHSSRFHDAICRYLLLSDHSQSPQTLRQAGFKLTTAITAMFDYANPEDFNDIIKLRHSAYGANNTVVAKLDPKDLLDEFDENARHFVYRAHGKIVASARAIVNSGIKKHSEIIGKYEAKLDVDIWDSPFIEISKFCVVPDYQQTDLAIQLVNQSCRMAYETQHPFIVCTCEAKLLNYWKRIGFKAIGPTFELKEHTTILYPLRASVKDLLSNDFASDLRKFLNYES
jgi:predicted GNAT family N-acyltransferase